AAYLCSTEALFIADADGTLSHWSEVFGQVVGSRAVRGTMLSQLFHQDDREFFAATWARLHDATGPLDLRGRVLTAEDIHATFSCVLRKAPQGGVIFGSLRQAPDGGSRVAGSGFRKGESADMLRVLSDNLPVIVWAIDRDGIFTYHGGKGAEELGFKWGQLV